jgi:hypothetical protein
MAEAAYATGPALLGAPRLLSSIFFEFFCSMFQCEIQTVRQCGVLKSPSPPENARPQNLKSEAPSSWAQTFFCSLFQCFSAGPQRAQGPQSESVRPQNLKSEVQIAELKRVFCFLFQRRIQTARGPKESKAPKSETPK